MGKIVDIERNKKTSHVRTTKRMDTPLKTVTDRIITGNNACTDTRRFIKKRSSRRNKNMMNKNKGGF